MKNSILLYLFLSYNFLFSYHNLMAQGSCVDDNTVIVDNLEHQTAFETLIYKTTIITNVLGIPTTVNIPLQVYYPTDLAPDEKRPLVVYIHGGFFIGGSLTDFSALAQETAQAGFIAATVDYRLCVTSDCLFAGATSYPCSVEWGNLLFRAYTAMIDVSDAIRFLQNKEDDYHIDSQNIIVGGHSAGALTALNLAYTDADEIASVCPTCPLAEPYVPANGIRACMPLSGAIYYTDWIDPDESNVSTILVHGTHDGVVPYDH
ncbi:MAG TPA: alpha/beta hydrolase, partial [Chitinophagales bacterium]|nr:alpha/beta hydrolase [Chitinophagales bacterium]